jgi:pimeloyl-ACP methyl ester carboxylesterase
MRAGGATGHSGKPKRLTFAYRLSGLHIDPVKVAVHADHPTMFAEQDFVNQRFGNDPDEYRSRIESFSNVQVATISDSGHNVQHDQPKQIASAMEEFLGRD